MNMYINSFSSWFKEGTSGFNLPYITLLYSKKHGSWNFSKISLKKVPRGYDIKFTYIFYLKL